MKNQVNTVNMVNIWLHFIKLKVTSLNYLFNISKDTAIVTQIISIQKNTHLTSLMLLLCQTPTYCQSKHFFSHIPRHVTYTRLKRAIENYTPFLFSQNTKEMSGIKLHGRWQRCLENFMFQNSSQPFPWGTGERGTKGPQLSRTYIYEYIMTITFTKQDFDILFRCIVPQRCS